MSETILNAALIGCGGRGRGHLETMKAFDDLRFVAVCDPVEELRDRVAAENNVRESTKKSGTCWRKRNWTWRSSRRRPT